MRNCDRMRDRFPAVLLCSVVFIAYATISPYIAILVRSMGFSQTVTGFFLGAAEISAIAAPFLFGAWADKRGNYRITFLAILFLWIVSGFAIFWVKNPFVAALFIPLVSAGYRSTVPLSDAVITVGLGKTGDYGKIRAVGSFSFVLVLLALQITPVRRPTDAPGIMFWNLIAAAALTGVVIFLPSSFLRPVRTPPERTRPERTRPAPETVSASPALSGGKPRSIWTPAFIVGIAVIFLNRLAFSPIQTYVSLYTVEYLHWDAVGLIFAISAFSEAPLIFLSNKLINRFGALPLITVTTAAVIVRLFCLALFPGKIILILTQFLHSLTFGVFHPAAIAFIVTSVPPEKRAVGMTVYMSLGTGLSTFIGNVAGGIIIEHLGYRALFGSFIFFALLALLISLVFGTKRPHLP
jgi:PPP family 3-phenylpropionic acid transporter